MTNQKRYDADKLLYRRQFILGPSFPPSFACWKKIQVRDGICITAHPDLNTGRVEQMDKSITLLGYILDPYSPDADDLAILGNLLNQLLTGLGFREWLQHTDSLGGRWLLVIDDGKEVRLVNDAIGTRQAFYTDVSMTQDMWCATQPGLIADVLKLQMNSVAVNEYVNSRVFQEWPARLWPADTSPYREIIRLLPNHYLNLSTGKCFRHWPDRSLQRLSLEQSAELSGNLLKSLLRSASNRFDLAHSVSAGWDSRLLLAASKDISNRIDYFTIRLRRKDFITTPKLLSKLGLKSHLVVVPGRMNREFGALYRRNMPLAHDFRGRIAQGWHEVYPQGRVCISGDAAEITRVRFRLPKGDETVTARSLARFTSFHAPTQMEAIPFVIRAWEKWLSRLGNTHNIHVLDLFYWEHWGGNFAAMDLAEADIVFESFMPYSCRTLLTTMLSADEAFRDHDEPVLYREIIKVLWPDVLAVPVNPMVPPKSAFLVKVLRKTGLYPLARRCLKVIKSNCSLWFR